MSDSEGGFDVKGGNEEPFGDVPTDEPSNDKPSNDKPFDDEPFDAGVEVSEEDDPKKFIQQLSGKLGTSLRKYTKEQGKPDFELEKYVINSILSATHTAEMDEEDQKDIIKKIKTSGEGKDDIDVDININTDKNDEKDINVDATTDEELTDQPKEEKFDENLKNSKKNSIFEENKLKDIIMEVLEKKFNIDTVIDEVLGDHMNTETQPIKPEEETITKPETKPDTTKRPRRERIWSPEPGQSPDPKAEL